MPVPYYPGSLYTPNLGLALYSVDSIIAENFVILDAAYGAGSSIFVNGTLVESPNLSSTTPAAPGGQELVTFQYDSNGNISAYVPIPAAGGVTSFTGDSVVYNNAASTGAVSLSLIAQTKNTVLAGPTTGANATPTFRALVAGDIPNNAANTTGTAANLSGTPALPNGTTATTQVATDATTLIATDAFVQNAIDAAAPLLGIPWFNLIDALDYNQVVPWYNGSPFAIDTGISRISAGVLGIGNGSAGDFSGTLKATIVNAGTGFRVNSAAASGHYLRGNGTNYIDGTIQAADVPTLNQNTTGSSGSCTGNAATATTAVNLSGSQTANYVYAAPNGSSGSASFRAMVVADLPVVTPAAGQGFWAGTGIMGTAPNTAFTASAAPGISAANAMACWLFYIAQPITVKQVTVSIAVAGAAGSVVDVGLYPAAASSTIVFGTNGGINGNSATVQSVGLYTWNGSAYASASSVTIPAGWYYFAYTASTVTTLTVYCTVQNSTEEPYTFMNNPSGSLSFLSMTGQATSGVLPHALPSGLVKGTTNGNMPACWISG